MGEQMNPGDHIAIQTLMHKYCDCMDRADFDGIGQLFAQATMTMPTTQFVKDPKGIAQIYRDFVKLYPDGTPRTRHVSTNALIYDDGPNRARATSYVIVFQATETFPLQPVIAGGYEDKFECVGGTWRFAERRMITDLYGNLSQHMKQSFGPDSEKAVNAD